MCEDGDQLFWMITSVEKVQYQQILDMYTSWMLTSKSLLDELALTYQQHSHTHWIMNPETQKYYVSINTTPPI